jgi:cobalamin biosynthetic protein CobC
MTRNTPPDHAEPADHGGGIDAVIDVFGGQRMNWIDLSTGINPQPYPVPALGLAAWAELPDQAAMDRLTQAARIFWRVPDQAAILAAPGASALIARIPALATAGRVRIPGPTYNEHARAFQAMGWVLEDAGSDAEVLVHPNNPDGRIWTAQDVTARLTIIDESFCDVMPEASLIALANRPGTLILKSFGKFWGLAGMRLGFAIGDPVLIAQLARMLGPWPVSGPALHIAELALRDEGWAAAARLRLTDDALRLDGVMSAQGARLVGGTSLFRLYEVSDASCWQRRLARHHIWTRTFPYNPRWLRLGLPGHDGHWARLVAAAGVPA